MTRKAIVQARRRRPGRQAKPAPKPMDMDLDLVANSILMLATVLAQLADALRKSHA
jgi:hypothetical protein